MYNYLRELHRQFCSEADCPAQRKELDSLQAELKNHLGQEERKLLLRLLDSQNIINYETSLESFAAGFRTAHSILCELKVQDSYSYEEEENKRICQGIGRGKEGTHE